MYKRFLLKKPKSVKRKPLPRAEKFIDFSKISNLELETIDRRLFVFPYSLHEDAIGKIHRVISGGAGPGDAETDYAWVKEISPILPEKSLFLIKVKKQKTNKEGDLVLCVLCQEYVRCEEKEVEITVFGTTCRKQ